MITPPSTPPPNPAFKKTGLFLVLSIVGILVVLLAVLLSQRGAYLKSQVFLSSEDASVPLSSELTVPVDPYTIAEADCLTSDEPLGDCLGAAQPEPDTVELQLNPDGTETIIPVTTPTLEETCESVKQLHILHCGHVAPEQNFACRTSESDAVYQECLAGKTSPDYSHSHDI